MKKDQRFLLRPIGYVKSSLTDRHQAPRQSYEDGAPEADLEINKEFVEGLNGVSEGDEIILLTWLHEASREVLKVHPQREMTAEMKGVFGTRSPDRPNPVGLHRVRVLKIDGTGSIKVAALEAIDGTPIIDIKRVLGKTEDS